MGKDKREAAKEISCWSEKADLFWQRAVKTKKLRDILKYSDLIIDFLDQYGGVAVITSVSWIKAHVSLYELCKANIVSWLLLISNYKLSHRDKNWSLLFYEYMAEGNTIQWDSFTIGRVSKYETMIANILEYQGLQPELREFAKELLEYFRTHLVDSYGCVVGQNPSKKILLACKEIDRDQLRRYSPFDNEMQSVDEYEEKYIELLSRIVQWAEQEPTSAMKQIQKTVALIRNSHSFAPGQLVLVQTEEEETWIYARIAGKANGSMISVYTTPEENFVVTFELYKVLSIPKNVINKYFTTDDCLQLEKCVQNTYDSVYRSIMAYCMERSVHYMERHGVDTAVVELALKNMCMFRHARQLKKAVDILREDVEENFLLETVKEIQNIVQSYKARLSRGSPFDYFRLTHNNHIRQLEEFDGKRAFLSYVIHMKGCCLMEMDGIQIRKQAVLSGQKKQQLVDEWLERIDRRVETLLKKHGFDPSAVPENYIDTEPADIVLVRKNLVLLRRIIKSQQSTGDKFGIKALIQAVCGVTYSTIDDFIGDIEFCLSEHLDCVIDPSTPHSVLFERISSHQDKDGQLLGLAQDREYLMKMKRMEVDPEFAGTQRMAVVPISGLIMSKLCRVENEHVTTLNLWEPAVLAKGEHWYSNTETAVIQNSVTLLNQYLKEGTVYINEADCNGSTLLHLSCSYFDHKPRLEVTMSLLLNPEIDICVRNYVGNTPLHYFVQIAPEDGQTFYFEIIQEFIKKNPNVLDVKNDNGETVLHRAILFQNCLAVEVLLTAGADVSCRDVNGETPLHYAVKSGNVALIKLLLSRGADPYLENDLKENSLHLSVKLGRTGIISLWKQQGFKVTEDTTQRRFSVSLSNITSCEDFGFWRNLDSVSGKRTSGNFASWNVTQQSTVVKELPLKKSPLSLHSKLNTGTRSRTSSIPSKWSTNKRRERKHTDPTIGQKLA